MDPVTGAIIAAAAPTVLGIVWGWIHHLTAKSHNDTIRAVVAAIQPAATQIAQAKVDEVTKRVGLPPITVTDPTVPVVK